MTPATTDTTLRPGQCYDWWRIITDLQMHMTMVAMAEVTRIPRTTLIGFKNGNVEPKHADGEQLLQLWRLRMAGAPPVVMCDIRKFQIRQL
jgi:hypothetical protein